MLFLFITSYAGYSQDTVVHAVNDPVMMHYYTKHLFWIVLSLTVVLLLFYSGRQRKLKKRQTIEENKKTPYEG